MPLGCHVCLSSSVRGVDGSGGTWSTSGNTLILDPVSGVAASHHIGRSVVLYQVNKALTTTAEVVVVPITKVRFCKYCTVTLKSFIVRFGDV